MRRMRCPLRALATVAATSTGQNILSTSQSAAFAVRRQGNLRCFVSCAFARTTQRFCASTARFTRTTSARSPNAEANSTPHYVHSGPLTTRLLSQHLRRTREELRRRPTEAHRVLCLHQLMSNFPLMRVRDLDAATVVQCLRFLSQLQAPADASMVRDAAGWLALHTLSLAPTHAVQALHALVLLKYDDLETVVQAMKEDVIVPVCQAGDQGTQRSSFRASSALASQPLRAGEAETGGVAPSASLHAILLGVLLRVLSQSCFSAELLSHAHQLRENVKMSLLEALPLSDVIFMLDALGAAARRGREQERGMALAAPLPPWLRSQPVWAAFAEDLWGTLKCCNVDALSFMDALAVARNLFLVKGQPAIMDHLAPRILAHLRKQLRGEEEAHGGLVTPITPSVPELIAFLEESGSAQGSLAYWMPRGEREALHAQALERIEAFFASQSSAPKCAGNDVVAPLLCTAAQVLQALLSTPLAQAATANTVGNEGETGLKFELKTCVPSSLLHFVANAANGVKRDIGCWTPAAVHGVLRCFMLDSAYRTTARTLATAYYKSLHERSTQESVRHGPSEFVCLLVDGLIDLYAEDLVEAVKSHLDLWDVNEVLYFLKYACEVRGKTTRSVMRAAAEVLAKYASRASASQITALMRYYGKAGVRNDSFCDAVTVRLHTLATSEDLSLRQISDVLAGFASVEYRATKPFVDAAPRILAALPSAGNCALEVSRLMAAYSKMLIWNFKVIWGLAEKMVQLVQEEDSPQACNVSMEQLLVAQLALIRMDVQHAHLTKLFIVRVSEEVLPAKSPIAALTSLNLAPFTRELSHREALSLLSVLSRISGAVLKESPDVYEQHAVCVRHLATVLQSHVFDLAQDADAVAEALLSLARMGLVKDPLFDALALKTVDLVPVASPLALAHFARAHAIAERNSEEFFALVAKHVIYLKDRISAVTIGSILASFAAAGVRNEQLFIDMIPRVRHVARYGSSKDISNVVYAYAKSNLWHYKLFAQLADRAVQLRAEFRSSCMARMLEAYATLSMRYEKLFVEFTPRVQTVAHLMGPSEVAAVAFSYAAVHMESTPVFQACADRAVEIAPEFSPADARKLLQAFDDIGFKHAVVLEALGLRFPDLAEEFKSVAMATQENEANLSTAAAAFDESNAVSMETLTVLEKDESCEPQ